MNRIVVALAALLLAWPASAQTIKTYDQFNAASSVASTDLIAVWQGANPLHKATGSQVAAMVLGLTTGDCTYSTYAITCTKTGGVSFGTFATQNAPTGSTQCLQANSSGTIAGTGAPCGGSGSVPGGSSGQVQYNNAGSYGGFTVSGDCTLNTTTGAITCTKINGDSNVSFLDVKQSFTKAQGVTISALTSGATITPDFSLSNNYSLTLATNATLANPTNVTAGFTYHIVIKQDATGSRTLAYGTNYKWSGGTAPTLSVAANATDMISCYVADTTHFLCGAVANFQ